MKYGELTLDEIETLIEKIGGVNGVRQLLLGATKVVAAGETSSLQVQLTAEETPILPKKSLPISGRSAYKNKHYLRPFSKNEVELLLGFDLSERLRDVIVRFVESGNEPMAEYICASDRMMVSKMLAAHPDLSGRLAQRADYSQFWLIG